MTSKTFAITWFLDNGPPNLSSEMAAQPISTVSRAALCVASAQQCQFAGVCVDSVKKDWSVKNAALF